MLQELRYALRGASRQPGLTAAVIAILGLGIGVNVAIFTVVDRLLLRPPPHLLDPQSLARVYIRQFSASAMSTITRRFVAFPEYLDIARHTGESPEGAAFSPSTESVRIGGSIVRTKCLFVTDNYFNLLGPQPVRGRFFAGAATDVAGDPVAVISYGIWQRLFGGSERALEQTITLGDRQLTIIGIAPQGFSGVTLDAPDVWIPVGGTGAVGLGPNWSTNRHSFAFQVVTRLHTAVNPSRLATEALVALREGSLGDPVDPGYVGITVGPVIAATGPDGYQSNDVRTVLLLYGMSGLVLLIGCANVINLLLFRVIQRRREIAIRLALGSSRARLAGQLLQDGLVLSLAGGLVGSVLAWMGASALRKVMLPRISWAGSAVDARSLLVVTVAAVLVGAIIGVLPAIRGARTELTTALHDTWRAGRVHGSFLRQVLLVAQLALSIVLVAAAAFFWNSWLRATSLHLGVDTRHVAAIEFDPATIPAPRQSALYLALAARARGLNWVAATSRATTVPFHSSTLMELSAPESEKSSGAPSIAAFVSGVTSNYFRTLGIPIAAGRSFMPFDRAGTEQVAIVSQHAARVLWPDQSALGQCVRLVASGTCARVVGVVADARRMKLLEDPGIQLYFPLDQLPGMPVSSTLLVRTTDEATRHLAAFVNMTDDVLPRASAAQQPSVFALQNRVDLQTRPWRKGTILFGLLGLLAVCVAAIGLYSAISYDVIQRRHDFGIRLALGALPAQIVRQVLWESLRVALVGVALGGMLAALGARVFESLLFETSTANPAVLGLAAMLLMVVCGCAALFPALAAARGDPMLTMRCG